MFGAGSKGQGRSGATAGQQAAANRQRAAGAARRGGSAVRQPVKAAPVQIARGANTNVRLRGQ
jgi:hypothetical protein